MTKCGYPLFGLHSFCLYFADHPVPSSTQFPVLPPAPSVNFPLDLEGRGVLMSHDMVSDFIEDWYPPNSNNEWEANSDGVQVQPSVYSNNPRMIYGPLPVPPSYQDAQYLPSHPPVQPPLPPPVSIPIEEEQAMETAVGNDEDTTKKKNNDGDKTSQIEEMRIVMQEQLELERAKMKAELKEELKEERKKDKAAFEEKLKEQELEFKRQVQELEKTLKKEYEKEKAAILKNSEEMKHYWESIQLENKHQRQMVINQVMILLI